MQEICIVFELQVDTVAGNSTLLGVSHLFIRQYPWLATTQQSKALPQYHRAITKIKQSFLVPLPTHLPSHCHLSFLP